MKTWRFVLAALACSPMIASAATVEFVNQSSWEIHEIYFSPASNRNWGDDYLGSEVLEKGDALTLTDIEAGTWDVMLVDEDGDECVLEDIDYGRSDRDRWVITDKDLLTCQAGS